MATITTRDLLANYLNDDSGALNPAPSMEGLDMAMLDGLPYTEDTDDTMLEANMGVPMSGREQPVEPTPLMDIEDWQRTYQDDYTGAEEEEALEIQRHNAAMGRIQAWKDRSIGDEALSILSPAKGLIRALTLGAVNLDALNPETREKLRHAINMERLGNEADVMRNKAVEIATQRATADTTEANRVRALTADNFPVRPEQGDRLAYVPKLSYEASQSAYEDSFNSSFTEDTRTALSGIEPLTNLLVDIENTELTEEGVDNLKRTMAATMTSTVSARKLGQDTGALSTQDVIKWESLFGLLDTLNRKYIKGLTAGAKFTDKQTSDLTKALKDLASTMVDSLAKIHESSVDSASNVLVEGYDRQGNRTTINPNRASRIVRSRGIAKTNADWLASQRSKFGTVTTDEGEPDYE